MLQLTRSLSVIFRSLILGALFALVTLNAKAQYLVQGKIDFPDTNYSAYLTVLNESDDFGQVTNDMILKKCRIDTMGRFQFEGNRLPDELGFYRVHFAYTHSTPIYLDSSPNEKNYCIFLLTNSDSVSVALNQTNFVPGSYKMFSSIPENLTLLDLIILNDRSEISFNQSNTKSLQKSILEKRKDDFLGFIDNSSHGLLNLFALYQARVQFNGNSQVYRKVVDEIRSDEYRECYAISLDKFIGAGSYRDLEEQNAWLRQMLIGSGGLIFILLILLIIQWRRRRPHS